MNTEGVVIEEMTAAQFVTWINNAIRASDVKAAVDILHVMAVYHPREAGEVRAAMLLGLAQETPC